MEGFKPGTLGYEIEYRAPRIQINPYSFLQDQYIEKMSRTNIDGTPRKSRISGRNSQKESVRDYLRRGRRTPSEE